MKILLTVILLSSIVAAQNKYSIQPGIKNNQIVLELSNISSTEPAQISLTKPLQRRGFNHIIFSDNTEKTILLNPQEEKEIIYTFDVDYNIGKTEADTIEFMITDNKSIYLTKQFILEYSLPTEYKLEQNYPNPFNPVTKIRYSIPNVTLRQAQGDNQVTLKVYDILGNEVTTLVNEKKAPGYYEVEFDALEFSSGVYFYRLQIGSFMSTKKMILLR